MKKVINKKEITLDDLARMIGSLEQSMDKKLGSLEKSMDGKLDSLEQSMDEKIDSLAQVTAKSFESIEKDLCEVKEDIKTIRQGQLEIGDRYVSRSEFEHHILRFNRLEAKIERKNTK